MPADAAPLFPKLLGPSFDALPAVIRGVHAGPPQRRFAGRCRVERGGGLLSRLIGRLANLPDAAEEIEVRVAIDAADGRETWARDFGGRVFRSRLGARGGLLEERIGLATFAFALGIEPGAIRWQLARARVLGIAVPASWIAMSALESSRDGRYCFEVRAAIAGVGLLVDYRGTLEAQA